MISFNRVLKSSSYESWTIIGPYYSCFLFNGLLFGLLVLSLMWSWTIGYMVYQKLAVGEVMLAFFPVEGRAVALNTLDGRDILTFARKLRLPG